MDPFPLLQDVCVDKIIVVEQRRIIYIVNFVIGKVPDNDCECEE